MSKICTKCHTSLRLSDFHKDKSTKDGRYPSCRSCNNNRAREYYSSEKGQETRKRHYVANKDRKYLYNATKLYNITSEQYNQMFVDQNGACAICKRPQDETRTRLCVDHCHRGEYVRGLLCHKCNQALGLFQDSIDNLLEAVKYLSK